MKTKSLIKTATATAMVMGAVDDDVQEFCVARQGEHSVPQPGPQIGVEQDDFVGSNNAGIGR